MHQSSVGAGYRAWRRVCQGGFLALLYVSGPAHHKRRKGKSLSWQELVFLPSQGSRSDQGPRPDPTNTPQASGPLRLPPTSSVFIHATHIGDRAGVQDALTGGENQRPSKTKTTHSFLQRHEFQRPVRKHPNALHPKNNSIKQVICNHASGTFEITMWESSLPFRDQQQVLWRKR